MQACGVSDGGDWRVSEMRDERLEMRDLDALCGPAAVESSKAE